MTTVHLRDRLWVYNDPGDWDWPRFHVFTTGHDEYGHKTLVVRLPRRRALVWAYWTCRDEECQLEAARTRQWEGDVRRIAETYGITIDEVYDLDPDAWDRVLGVDRTIESVERIAGKGLLPWQRRVLFRVWRHER